MDSWIFPYQIFKAWQFNEMLELSPVSNKIVSHVENL